MGEKIFTKKRIKPWVPGALKGDKVEKAGVVVRCWKEAAKEQVVGMSLEEIEKSLRSRQRRELRSVEDEGELLERLVREDEVMEKIRSAMAKGDKGVKKARSKSLVKSKNTSVKRTPSVGSREHGWKEKDGRKEWKKTGTLNVKSKNKEEEEEEEDDGGSSSSSSPLSSVTATTVKTALDLHEIERRK